VYLCVSGAKYYLYCDIAPNTAFKKHICLTFIFGGGASGEKTGRKEEYLAICLVISLLGVGYPTITVGNPKVLYICLHFWIQCHLSVANIISSPVAGLLPFLPSQSIKFPYTISYYLQFLIIDLKTCLLFRN